MVGGTPEIEGGGSDVDVAVLVAVSTCIVNAGRDALFQPSLTAITILAYVPALPAEGVPESRPVLLLKVAHEGWLVIPNVNVRPDVSVADG